MRRKNLGAGLLIVGGALLTETWKWGWKRFLDSVADGTFGPVSFGTLPWLEIFGFALMITGVVLLWPKSEKVDREALQRVLNAIQPLTYRIE
ncbi:MAG: hypothetical protein QOG72_3321, partial [Sphingomonadales bacterium]|nr:hypothetical protein [Sphingomonadales bacterium]